DQHPVHIEHTDVPGRHLVLAPYEDDRAELGDLLHQVEHEAVVVVDHEHPCAGHLRAHWADPYASSSSMSTRRNALPTAVLGSVSRSSTSLGTLYADSCCAHASMTCCPLTSAPSRATT